MVRTKATEDAALDILEWSTGCGHGRGQAPRDNPPPPPPRAPVSISWSGSPAAPLVAGHEHVLLRLFGNSSVDLSWGKRPARCKWLAPHHWIKIWLVTLHKVPEDSVCRTTAERSNRGLVGIIYRNTASRSPRGVGWVPHCIALCDHHLSVGTVHHKLVEFLELRQGNRSVYEYTQEFNNLAQYGGHHVNTDVKKAKLYHKGLNIQLQDRLI
jgi:hypothetical protein